MDGIWANLNYNEPMKPRILALWNVSLLLAALPFTNGCDADALPQNQSADATNNFSSGATAASPTGSVSAVTAAVTNALALSTNPPTPAQPDPVAAKPAPPDVPLSSSLKEVTKMAQAGVDDTVMLAFITNSPSTFNLGSAQIIYLNDLGLAAPVISAMIAHDQEIAAGLRPATASTVPSPLPAALPPMPAPGSASAAPAPAATLSAEAPAAPQYAPAYASPPPPATGVEQPAAPPPAVDYNYFYDSLAPYGTWIDVAGYGRCWQPTVTVINAGWRPYCDSGRWLYTDNGWYWASDYSWGGIAFHYGRWFSDPRWGWCWWPDTCWGPSWVTWRYSDAYCGWAPLPPLTYWSPGIGFTYYGGASAWSIGFGFGWNTYSFVPWNRFGDRRPGHYRLGGEHAMEAYNHSTIANHYGNGRDHGVVNQGIDFDRVRQYSHNEIRKVAIRDVPNVGHAVQPDRVLHERGQFVVQRPSPPPAMSRDLASRAGSGPAATPRSTPTGRSEVRAPGRSALAGGSPLVTRSEPASAPVPVRRPTAVSAAPRSVSPSSIVLNQERRRTDQNLANGNPAVAMTPAPAPSRPMTTSYWQERSAARPAMPAQPDRGSAQLFSRPAPAAPAPSQPAFVAPAPAPTRTFSAPAAPAPSYAPPPVRPSYTPPAAPAYSPAPSYSRPAPTPAPAPAPAYRPTPSYSPPAMSAPRPAPSPAPSAPGGQRPRER